MDSLRIVLASDDRGLFRLSLFEQKGTTYEDSFTAAALLPHHDSPPSPGNHLQPLVFAQPWRQSLAIHFPALEGSFAGGLSPGAQYPHVRCSHFPAAGIMDRFQVPHVDGELGWPVDQSGSESCGVSLLLRALLVASSALYEWDFRDFSRRLFA